MPVKTITLDLTPAEAAVLSFLINVDPDWGEPPKDIEDGYGREDDPFEKQAPYAALEALKVKWGAASRKKP